MPTVRLAFSASNLIGSKIIRYLTWSQLSHVGIVCQEDDTVIEAAYPEVREVPMSEFVKDKTLVLLVDFPCERPELVLGFARSQLGKHYDLGALFSFFSHDRQWNDSSKWFCSELVAWALAKGGVDLFRSDTLGRVTPQHLWMINPESLKS